MRHDFAQLDSFQSGWAKLRRGNPALDAPADFDNVTQTIQALLLPILDGMARGVWNPAAQAWGE